MKATDWPPARLPAHVGPSVRPSVSFLVHDSAFRTNLVAPIQSVPLGQHAHIVTATEASERASKRRRIYALTIRHCVPRHYQPLPYLFPPRSEAKRSYVRREQRNSCPSARQSSPKRPRATFGRDFLAGRNMNARSQPAPIFIHFCFFIYQVTGGLSLAVYTGYIL